MISSCIEILDVISLRPNIEQISSGWLKVVINHISNLTPSRESAVLLSSLLFDTDSSSERGIRDHSSQRRRNPRIKYFRIREVSSYFNWLQRHRIVYWSCHLHFIDPQHCELRERCTHTHTSVLNLTLQHWKSSGFWDFSEMQFREIVYLGASIIQFWE